jgi:glycosyltransferase involved in cell wall biosynthesis
MMTRLVSVIMPVYNAEKFVNDAILSVINQSWPHWELLIVNDGSTDNSASCINSFNDQRIRYFAQNNQGVSAARNLGLQQMKGDFFCFLDADDVLPTNSLEDRLAVFRDEAVYFVDGAVKVFDDTMKNILYTWRPAFKGSTFEKLIRLDASVFFGPSWMIRREAGKTYRMDETLSHCEDLFFYISIADRGQYSFTAACTLHYRKNLGSAMSDFDGLAKGYTQLVHRIQEIFGNRISSRARWILLFKTRKIMFLSFLSIRNYRKAFRYLLKGKT